MWWLHTVKWSAAVLLTYTQQTPYGTKMWLNVIMNYYNKTGIQSGLMMIKKYVSYALPIFALPRCSRGSSQTGISRGARGTCLSRFTHFTLK